jgi:negative regulator of flagellin synthesis FlgM
MVSDVNGSGISALTGLDQRGTKIGESRAMDAPQSTRAKGAEVVTLTDLAARLQALTQSVADLPVADREKVEAFRQSVAEGSYEVDPQAVAEKLSAIESMLADITKIG